MKKLILSALIAIATLCANAQKKEYTPKTKGFAWEPQFGVAHYFNSGTFFCMDQMLGAHVNGTTLGGRLGTEFSTAGVLISGSFSARMYIPNKRFAFIINPAVGYGGGITDYTGTFHGIFTNLDVGPKFGITNKFAMTLTVGSRGFLNITDVSRSPFGINAKIGFAF